MTDILPDIFDGQEIVTKIIFIDNNDAGKAENKKLPKVNKTIKNPSHQQNEKVTTNDKNITVNYIADDRKLKSFNANKVKSLKHKILDSDSVQEENNNSNNYQAHKYKPKNKKQKIDENAKLSLNYQAKSKKSNQKRKPKNNLKSIRKKNTQKQKETHPQLKSLLNFEHNATIIQNQITPYLHFHTPETTNTLQTNSPSNPSLTQNVADSLKSIRKKKNTPNQKTTHSEQKSLVSFEFNATTIQGQKASFFHLTNSETTDKLQTNSKSSPSLIQNVSDSLKSVLKETNTPNQKKTHAQQKPFMNFEPNATALQDQKASYFHFTTPETTDKIQTNFKSNPSLIQNASDHPVSNVPEITKTNEQKQTILNTDSQTENSDSILIQSLRIIAEKIIAIGPELKMYSKTKSINVHHYNSALKCILNRSFRTLYPLTVKYVLPCKYEKPFIDCLTKLIAVTASEKNFIINYQCIELIVSKLIQWTEEEVKRVKVQSQNDYLTEDLANVLLSCTYKTKTDQQHTKGDRVLNDLLLEKNIDSQKTTVSFPFIKSTQDSVSQINVGASQYNFSIYENNFNETDSNIRKHQTQHDAHDITATKNLFVNYNADARNVINPLHEQVSSTVNYNFNQPGETPKSYKNVTNQTSKVPTATDVPVLRSYLNGSSSSLPSVNNIFTNITARNVNNPAYNQESHQQASFTATLPQYPVNSTPAQYHPEKLYLFQKQPPPPYTQSQIVHTSSILPNSNQTMNIHGTNPLVQNVLPNNYFNYQHTQIINTNTNYTSGSLNVLQSHPSKDLVENCNVLNALPVTSFNPERSLSRDSGFISPSADNADISPMITYVTSLNKNVAYTKSGACIVCNMTTKLKCLGCFQTYYCSTKCQYMDWENHAVLCKPKTNQGS